jgi:hypothetical protein
MGDKHGITWFDKIYIEHEGLIKGIGIVVGFLLLSAVFPFLWIPVLVFFG